MTSFNPSLEDRNKFIKFMLAFTNRANFSRYQVEQLMENNFDDSKVEMYEGQRTKLKKLSELYDFCKDADERVYENKDRNKSGYASCSIGFVVDNALVSMHQMASDLKTCISHLIPYIKAGENTKETLDHKKMEADQILNKPLKDVKNAIQPLIESIDELLGFTHMDPSTNQTI